MTTSHISTKHETMPRPDYYCLRCSHTEFEQGEMRATGGFWSKFFNIQTEKFISITCRRCQFTEFYKRSTSTGENIFDFFGN